MAQVSLRGDFLRDAVFEVFGEDAEDPLGWLKDRYAAEIATYRGPGDPLAVVLSIATGLDCPAQGDVIIFFLRNGNFGPTETYRMLFASGDNMQFNNGDYMEWTGNGG